MAGEDGLIEFERDLLESYDASDDYPLVLAGRTGGIALEGVGIQVKIAPDGAVVLKVADLAMAIKGLELEGTDQIWVRPPRKEHDIPIKPGLQEEKLSVVEFREGFSFDMNTRAITVDGVEESLTEREFDLFYYMVINQGVILSYSQIMMTVWGYREDNDDRRSLRTILSRVRTKMTGKHSDCIKLVRNIGYVFDPRVDDKF